MNDAPITPEACRAEQEKLLKQVSETESQNWSLMVEVRMGKSRLLIVDGDEEGIAEVRGKKNADLIAQAPTLARQYAALLAAHAEALERERELEAEAGRMRNGLETVAHYLRAWGTDDVAVEAERRVNLFLDFAPGGAE